MADSGCQQNMREAYSDRTSKIVEGKLKKVGGTPPVGKTGFIFKLKQVPQRFSGDGFRLRESLEGEDN
ncbi:MAG: hypothetical protein CMJ81_13990 [Planctomycetaceae bacterium]|nr:hypothetical protein [Planctomycetaceae bacterium]MBP61500.1 hypothetical protein [Planctomycetaceae bacterium]